MAHIRFRHDTCDPPLGAMWRPALKALRAPRANAQRGVVFAAGVAAAERLARRRRNPLDIGWTFEAFRKSKSEGFLSRQPELSQRIREGFGHWRPSRRRAKELIAASVRPDDRNRCLDDIELAPPASPSQTSSARLNLELCAFRQGPLTMA